MYSDRFTYKDPFEDEKKKDEEMQRKLNAERQENEIKKQI